MATPLSREPATRARSIDTEMPERTRIVTRLNSLIRPQPWVNWFFVVLGIGLWVGTIALGWIVDHSDSGLKQVLGLKAGRLAGLFGATCLLGATQLSLVTLWYRTHSRKDFQGRYRIWIWSSLIWGTLFSAAISGWHRSGSEWLERHLPGRLQVAAGSAWLLGVTILVATAMRLLSQDMSRARSTICLLRGAQLVAALTLLFQFEPGLAPAGIVREIQAALASLWPLLMASALLHNARYVIHVSNEAMPSLKRPSRLSPILQQIWAEVLSMGPSRSTVASTVSPQNLWRIVVLTWNGSRGLTQALARLVYKRGANAGANRSKSQSADRRKTSPALPTIAASTDSAARATHKSPAKSTKSA